MRALLWTRLKMIRKEHATHIAVAFDAMAGRARPGPAARADELLRSQYIPATDEAKVRARFGVSPRSIPDFHALVGDPSDGIPGLLRWGRRAAALVLDRHETIEDIPTDPARWEAEVRGARALAELLRARRREVILMRDLSRLRTDVPISDEVSDLKWRGAHRPALAEIVHRIGAEGRSSVCRSGWNDRTGHSVLTI